jgi:hypothetical protein
MTTQIEAYLRWAQNQTIPPFCLEIVLRPGRSYLISDEQFRACHHAGREDGGRVRGILGLYTLIQSSGFSRALSWSSALGAFVGSAFSVTSARQSNVVRTALGGCQLRGTRRDHRGTDRVVARHRQPGDRPSPEANGSHSEPGCSARDC